ASPSRRHATPRHATPRHDTTNSGNHKHHKQQTSGHHHPPLNWPRTAATVRFSGLRGVTRKNRRTKYGIKHALTSGEMEQGGSSPGRPTTKTGGGPILHRGVSQS